LMRILCCPDQPMTHATCPSEGNGLAINETAKAKKSELSVIKQKFGIIATALVPYVTEQLNGTPCEELPLLWQTVHLLSLLQGGIKTCHKVSFILEASQFAEKFAGGSQPLLIPNHGLLDEWLPTLSLDSV